MMRRIFRCFLFSTAGVVGLALTLIATVAVIVFVRYQLNDRQIYLPPPRGPYPIGRSLVQWHDKIRNRDLMVFIWYPAIPGAAGGRCEYLPGKWGEINAQNMLPIPAK